MDRKIQKIKEGTKEFEIFAEALHEVNETLAKKMAGDGEGATALFEVTVRGADTKEQAKTLAKSVVCSNLTKRRLPVMMQTGDGSCVLWAIPVPNLIRRK